MTTTQTATFGAGCFWSAEAAFRRVPGVVDTAVGYADTENPVANDTGTGVSANTEVVQVQYDPKRVSFEQLLDAFWDIEDPTDPHQSEEYRSVILFSTPEQAAEAQASKERLERSGRFHRPIVTEIRPAPTFYRARESDQRYLERHGSLFCATA